MVEQDTKDLIRFKVNIYKRTNVPSQSMLHRNSGTEIDCSLNGLDQCAYVVKSGLLYKRAQSTTQPLNIELPTWSWKA